MVEQFCKSILQIENGNTKALANVVMGLGSQVNSNSVVGLSLSPCFHYQYSSINKSISSLYEAKDIEVGETKIGKERLAVEKKFVY